ncbi:MAG TPA: glycosyl hydrolase family 32 [Micromonosporaceae bacterium]|nr:glycosyl hydrolase family 32 [Micromonosporaceae bacterium]
MMGLRLGEHWVWDSWVADDGENYHLFFLRAARSLRDPVQRHYSASIGHAVSPDLRTWRVLPDALAASGSPAWDDMATWTGSVVRGPDGIWQLFYTGLSRAEGGLVQRIGVATSPDLLTWTRDAGAPLEADARWYEKAGLGVWHEEAWRDPFVFADPAGDGWHMLITARAASGPVDGRGVIGHARSLDLRDWQVGPPLTEPAGFGHLEVSQSRIVDGVPVLVFSCQPAFLSATRRALTRTGDVWFVPGATELGPWDFDRAYAWAHPSLYAGQLLRDRDGQWLLLGFRDLENGEFVGEIVDPIHVRLQDGALTVSEEPNPART